MLKLWAKPTNKRAYWVMICGILFCVLMIILWLNHGPSDRVPRPKIAIMSSLPLRAVDHDIHAAIATKGENALVYQRLSYDFEISMIDNMDQYHDAKSILLLAQPRALRPSELVKIDALVRGGSNILIFADPALEWESDFSIGDKRRPLFTSLLSPLLTHWGLDLVLPMDKAQKSQIFHIGALSLRTRAPGAWQVRDDAEGAHCMLSAESLVAACNIGKGHALLVADADLLDSANWQGTGLRAALGKDDFGNMAIIKKWIFALTEKDGKP